MLTIEFCNNKIKELNRIIAKFPNPTSFQVGYIEHLKNLKIAYAVEMTKAMEREEEEWRREEMRLLNS